MINVCGGVHAYVFADYESQQSQVFTRTRQIKQNKNCMDKKHQPPKP